MDESDYSYEDVCLRQEAEIARLKEKIEEQKTVTLNLLQRAAEKIEVTEKLLADGMAQVPLNKKIMLNSTKALNWRLKVVRYFNEKMEEG